MYVLVAHNTELKPAEEIQLICAQCFRNQVHLQLNYISVPHRLTFCVTTCTVFCKQIFPFAHVLTT